LSVSRRLANLPYFLWIAVFNSTQILAFCAVETVFFPALIKSSLTSQKEEEEVYKSSTSRVLEAFNRNGLFVFLVANLLTGAVNLTVPTLHVSDLEAIGILIGHTVVVTGLAVGLDIYNISITL
jgi:phosphatidylinositol glycan class W